MTIAYLTDTDVDGDDAMPSIPRSFSALLNGLNVEDIANGGAKGKGKEMVASGLTLSLDGANDPMPLLPDVVSPTATVSSTTLSTSSTATMSKREHALHELLSSERNYASDLALIRDVHIPLALGHELSIPIPSLATGSTSGSGHQPEAFVSTILSSSSGSARTVSTASDPASIPGLSSSSSTSSSTSLGAVPSTASTSGPSSPMTQDDVKILFSNIPELALFADFFSDQLQDALGDVLEGGSGTDCVGALFLRIIPALETPYRHYITRHSTAVSHLLAIPRTPALTSYLAQTQSIAQSLSHAWDISSLLIKPVQRILKYSLLLHAIIDATSPSHSDYGNLKMAKERMDEVARGINEGRRRWEVVRAVLKGKGLVPGEEALDGMKAGKDKKKGMGVGGAATVNLTRIKSNIRGSSTGSAGTNSKSGESSSAGSTAHEESQRIAAAEAEIRAMAIFTTEFGRAVVDWGKAQEKTLEGLRAWAVSFGTVLGLSIHLHPDAGDAAGGSDSKRAGNTPSSDSEAFSALLTLISSSLIPILAEMQASLQPRILLPLARLRATKEAPLKLIAAMKSHAPIHTYLLTTPFSPKNRPHPALLSSSQTYLALRTQLALELPTYLAALRKGLKAVLAEWVEIQKGWYCGAMGRWGELWDALRVEGEGREGGGEETMRVWWSRWEEVERVLGDTSIVRPAAPLHLNGKGYEQDGYGGHGKRAAMQHAHSMPIAVPSRKMGPPGPVSPSEVIVVGSPGSNRNAAHYQPVSRSHSMNTAFGPGVSTSNMGTTGSTLASLDASPGIGGSSRRLSKDKTSSDYAREAKDREKKNKAKEKESSKTKPIKTPRPRPSVATSVLSSLAPSSASPGGVSPDGRNSWSAGSTSGSAGRGRGRRGSDASSLYGQAYAPSAFVRPHNQHPARPDSLGSYVDVGLTYAYPALGGGPGAAGGNGTSVPLHPPPEYDYEHDVRGRERCSGSSYRSGVELGREGDKDLFGYGHANALEDERGRYADRFDEREIARSHSQGKGRMHMHGSSRQEQQASTSRHRASDSMSSIPVGSNSLPPGAMPPMGLGRSNSFRDRSRAERQREREKERPTTPTACRSSHASQHSVSPIASFQARNAPPHPRSSLPNALPRPTSSRSYSQSQPRPSSSPYPQPTPDSQESTLSIPLTTLLASPPLYLTVVVHPCKPPKDTTYQRVPFATLKEGRVWQVLWEAGHPGLHPGLPVVVDEGDDCLLLIRESISGDKARGFGEGLRAKEGKVGWALASFLMPLEG